MADVAVLIIVIGAGVLAAHAARRRGPPSVSLGATVVQAAALIAFIRLSLFWAGLALYSDYADWRQVAGYGLLVLNALLELALTASLSDRHPGPP